MTNYMQARAMCGQLMRGVADLATPKAHQALRIGVLIPTLELGGAERVASSLVNHWVKVGHAVTLMTYSSPGSDVYQLHPGVRRVVIGGQRTTSHKWAAFRKNLRRWHAVRTQLRRGDLDVVLSFLNVANYCLALANVGGKAACIGTERSYPPSEALTLMERCARRLTYGMLDAVVAQTEDSATWLRQHTPALAHTAIANPVQLPLPVAEPCVDPQHWLSRGAPIMLAVGRLHEVKRYDWLIHSFAQASRDLQRSHPAAPLWQLVVLGDGPLRDKLRALVDALGMQDQVHLLGRVGNVGDWLDHADAFAMTSRNEGYPNALLEALASGLPAVACDVKTGPRELIQHGVNGLLVADGADQDLKQALLQMMSDGEMRSRMAAAASSTLDKHAIHTISDRWEAVFTQAIRRRRSA